MTKKVIVIIATTAVVIIGALVFTQMEKPETTYNPPTVYANTGPGSAQNAQAPTPDIDYSQVSLPPSDNDKLDNLITEEEIMASREPEITGENAEETSDEVAYQEETNVVPEVTSEEIAEMNEKIELAKKEAEANPEVQKPFGEPIAIETTTPEPERDAEGYLFSKEEAVETFVAKFQELIDLEDFNYTSALDQAKKREGFTQDSFEADLNTLMTNPYSSARLSRAFDDYRKTGHLGALIGNASQWLGMGGDDGPWTKSVTQ